MKMVEIVRRGRHRILSDEVILRAALESFAAEGYESMSVRKLNTTLGLSHETVRQRFGSKRELYYAAVDFAIAQFYESLGEERALLPDAANDLEELRWTMRSFITASVRFPQLKNIVNHEAVNSSERLDYIFTSAFEPGMVLFGGLLDRLAADGVIYPMTIREAFFIIDAGMSPFAQVGLSRAFDTVAGPLEDTAHIDSFLDFIFRGITKPVSFS